MSQLMRMTYGRSGSRLEGILVSAPHGGSAAEPRWLTLLLLAVWITVPLLVCLFALPKGTPPVTVIDTSRLAEKPPTVTEQPIVPQSPRVARLERPAAPPNRVAPPPPPAVEKLTEEPRPIPQQKPVERKTVAAPPEESRHPVITRAAPPRVAEDPEYHPRLARERAPVATEAGIPADAHIRRGIAVREAPAGTPAVTRTRGADAALSLTGAGRGVPLRRVAAMEGGTPGAETPQRLATRSVRSSGGAEGNGAPRIAVARERKEATGAAGGEATAAIGAVRGFSLGSLEICASPQAEEDDIKALLSVLGTRQSCRDGKGEFEFKGTQRVSSFNLIIYPAKGRRPSNRCEELENAYRCLKNH